MKCCPFCEHERERRRHPACSTCGVKWVNREEFEAYSAKLVAEYEKEMEAINVVRETKTDS